MPSGQESSATGRLAPGRLLGIWADHEIADLHPAGFALVMATGVISNTFQLQGRHALSNFLFGAALLAYVWLWLLTGIRAWRWRAGFCSDLVDPARVFSFFTMVAATDVLGSGIAARGFAAIALSMWLVALALWLTLTYLGFGVLMLKHTSGAAGVIDGAWLNAIVGTQSLVILGTIVVPPLADPGGAALLLMHMLWVLGLALYGILIVLLAYRLFFFELAENEIGPTLWVIMGAAAISTNAGSMLIIAGNGGNAFLASILPFVGAVTLAMWAWATWWIPLLLLLGIWKHGVRGVPLRYTPMSWSIVFPLGMHAIASFRLARAAGIPALAAWSRVMIWIALGAWSLAVLGLAVSSWRSARRSARCAGPTGGAITI